LALHYEIGVQSNDATVSIPALTVHDVARQTGHIAVATGGNVKVDVATGVEGASRIDTTELPQTLVRSAQSPILHAFEYLEPGYLLPLEVQRLDDVAVRVASIDNAELTTVVTDDGMVITRARYQVRNNQRQFLRIDPGADAEIWGAQVDGHVVSPAKDTESETGVLIQLRKSHEGVAGLGGFPVELIYMNRMKAPSGLTHTLNLIAPTTDILADTLDWEVFMPEERHYVNSDGDLKEITTAPGQLRPERGALSFGKAMDVRRMREGIERFMITDINNPAGSAGAQHKEFRGTDFVADSAPASSTRLAGVLPVHINLPQTGIPHLFTRTLVPQGKALSLSIRTHNARFSRGIGWLSYPLAFALGVFLANLFLLVLLQKEDALRGCIAPTLIATLLYVVQMQSSINLLHLTLCAALGAAMCILSRRVNMKKGQTRVVGA
jgi:hypothetical protein